MIEGTSLFIGMFNNLAIFIVFVSLYAYIKQLPLKKNLTTLLLGLLFACALLLCMTVKIPVARGVLVDQRNAIVVLSTLFCGPVAGAITLFTGITMRTYLGGSGVAAGIIGLCLSFGAGNLLRIWKGERNITFFITGSLAATVIILPGFLFVGGFSNGWLLMKKMAIPYGTAIYLGMLFIGFLLQHEENRISTSTKLEKSEKKYRALYENLIDVSYYVNNDDIIMEISPSCKKLLGYFPHELIGLNVIKLYTDPERRQFFMNKLKSSGYIENFQNTVKRADGSTVMISINAVNEYDHNGTATGYYGIIRDITRLHDAQIEKAMLEKIIVQSQKMEALGTLAGGVAHDFNNILGAVLGYAELIKESSPEGSLPNKYSLEILKASDRAKNLIRQILLFSRDTTMQMEPTDIKTVIREALTLLRQTIPKTVDISCKDDEISDKIFGDSNQLHQVIINLVTNAYHALENETGKIELSVDKIQINESNQADYPGLSCGPFLSLSVKDNGKGIPEKYRPYIFDPFFTTKEKGKGTGLGLAVVHGIIKKHNGEIYYTSEIGEGTVFSVLIPVYQNEEKIRPVSETLSEDDHLPEGYESIMIIDDEEAIGDIEELMLRSLGYSVETFTDASEAKNEFFKNPEKYDLILTDQNMPGTTGLNLAKEIKSRYAKIPIIIATGYSSLLDSDDARGIGINKIIIKPVSKKTLALAVRETLDN